MTVKRWKGWKVGRDGAVTLALAGGTLVLLVATSAGRGLTYDEPVYAAVAGRNSQWFQYLAQSWRQGRLQAPFSRAMLDRYWHNRGPTQAHRDMHPPVVKLLSSLSQGFLAAHLGTMVAMRLPAMLLLALTVGLLYRWLAATVGRSAGLFAALALLTMPRVFGHAHLLTLDVPVAAMVFLATVLFWKAVTAGSWGWTVAYGIGFGLALGTKMNAVILPLPLAAWWIWKRWRNREARGSGGKAVSEASAGLAEAGKVALGTFLVAPLVFWGTWPWLWYDPLAHLKGYWTYHSQHYAVSVTYGGRLYAYAPWHYPAVMTLITTPTAILAMVGWGLGSQVRNLRLEGPARRSEIGVLLACNAVGHLLPFLLPGTPKYNGIRLFMPVFPFLAGLAGLGFQGLSEGLCRRLEGWAGRSSIVHWPLKLTVVLGLFLLLPGVVGIAQFYPYELSYYNALIGGLAGAYRRGMEPTYWGEAYFSALPFLNARAPQGALVYACPPGVASTLLEPYQRLGFLRSDLRLTGDETQARQADFAVFHTHDAELNATARTLFAHASPVHITALNGVPLLLIYDRTAWEETRAEPQTVGGGTAVGTLEAPPEGKPTDLKNLPWGGEK